MDDDKILYHYTSFEGFKGIIESRKIWATDIRFLNDANEFIYAKKLLINELTARKRSDDYLNVILQMLEILFTEEVGVFVCSFSEKKDVLSQWRGYCPNGVGINIGFSFKRLKDYFTSSPHNLVVDECKYDNQQSMINILLSSFLAKYDPSVDLSTDLEKCRNKNLSGTNMICISQFLTEFLELAPLVKDPGFKEESEWRIIIPAVFSGRKKDIKFRPTKYFLTPFIDLQLPLNDEKFIVDEVTIGPSNEHMLTEASIRLFLKSKDVTCHKISHSQIPYRV